MKIEMVNSQILKVMNYLQINSLLKTIRPSANVYDTTIVE